MRQITTFVVLLQVVWDIPNQDFTVCGASYNNKHLAYWKLDLGYPQLFKKRTTNGNPSYSSCLLDVQFVQYNKISIYRKHHQKKESASNTLV